jgi:hypothetical protein
MKSSLLAYFDGTHVYVLEPNVERALTLSSNKYVERALTLSSNKYVERALHLLATNMWNGPYTF